MCQCLERWPGVMRWARHRLCKAGGPGKGHAGMDEVTEKKASDKFLVNAVFGRERWSCTEIQ